MKNSEHRKTTHSVLDLVRDQLRTLVPYQSARRLFGADPKKLFLDANELPFEPQRRSFEINDYNHYADVAPRNLRRAYAAYAGVSEDNVIATRGADESIELLVRTFCEPGSDGVVFFPPTYGLYEITSTIHGAQVLPVPLLGDFNLDREAIARAPSNIKLVFLCNPNNPTGNLIPPKDLRFVLDTFRDRAIVAIDEAYIEFCPEQSSVPLLAEYENLVVIRTMSKAFGLAGIHVGFSLANREIIDLLRKTITPYPIPSPCAEIAFDALSPAGIGQLQSNRAHIEKSRTLFLEGLRKLENVERIYPGVGNFVLVKYKDADETFNGLVKRGIIARNQNAIVPLQGCIRFSIGTTDQMTLVLRALRSMEKSGRRNVNGQDRNSVLAAT